VLSLPQEIRSRKEKNIQLNPVMRGPLFQQAFNTCSQGVTISIRRPEGNG